MSVRVAVVGAAGYAGAELVRLLLGHPEVTLASVASRSRAGQPLDAVHPALHGFTDLVFDALDVPALAAHDVIFLAVPHGTARELAAALDEAVGAYLENARYPSRKVNEIDNRGSSFYLALYWAEALAARSDDPDLQARFAPVAAALSEAEGTINEELLAAQGAPVDIGGYFHPDEAACSAAMRPSATLNAIIDGL